MTATGACHEEIYDYYRNGNFYWATKQTCTGFYGLQFVSTQMWRSSWSGPRGYSAWVSSHTTSAAVLGPICWNVYCNNGKGYYDYYPVVQGYASRLGWGPTVRTSNSLHYDCGPSA